MSDTAALDSAGRAQKQPFDWLGFIARYGVVVALILCVIFFSAQEDKFRTYNNFQTVLEATAPLLMMALGLTVVLIMGDFDLSVSATAALASAIIVKTLVETDIPWGVAVLMALVVALVVGAVNGGLVAYVGTNSFITTLATGVIVAGLELSVTGPGTTFITGGDQIPDTYRDLGIGEPFIEIRSPVWIALVMAIVLWALLTRTEVGRFMYAIGGNTEAARLSGINVKFLRASGFIIVALCALVAGIAGSARTGSHVNSFAEGLLLSAFAAAFLGATMSKRGQFNIPGTVVGAAFLAIVDSGLTFMGYDQNVKLITKGTILVVAMLLGQLGSRRE